ncbi:hypothetical protein Q31b_25870 [Novipirellula aureliae]|uniref:Uncharacterized protein n=1 Tax=Novipirellula aureliae TaxID=2527966 RepID=A0A5C6E7V1_9BACT|nr:hypothetical protein [Novipirellula aureliae]TWU43546.1 hypothetical protein Q31b_25870 [Novipirellula aureliae]
MNAATPYESSAVQSRDDAYTCVPRATWIWVTAGGISGAAAPIIFVVHLLYRNSAFTAASPPEHGLCGVGRYAVIIGSIIIVIVGLPVCGLLGSFVGWLASKVRI